MKLFLTKFFIGLLALLGVQINQPQIPPLGYSVATGFQSTLSASITSAQSFIPVSSLTLKDNSVLNINTLGGTVFLDLEPGGSKEEIVMCTNINTSTKQFTSCTRGLAFSGTSTVSVAANQKPHNSGSTIMMSNVHYVYEQFVDVNTKSQTIQGDKTVAGTWTFTSFPVNTSSAVLPSLPTQFTTKFYVDTVGAGGFSANNVSNTQGTFALGTSPETIGIRPSSTLGMALDVAGNIYQKTSSTAGVSSDVNGIYVKAGDQLNFDGSGNLQLNINSSTVNNFVSSSFNQTVNTLETYNKYYTYTVPLIPDSNNTNYPTYPRLFGFTTDGNGANNFLRYGNYVSSTFAASPGWISMPLMGSSTQQGSITDNNTIRIKFRARMVNDQNLHPAFIGIAPSGAVVAGALGAASTSILARLGFSFSGINASNVLITTITGNSTAVSKTLLTGDNASIWHTYEIVASSTQALFYLDGTLRATHNSNIFPTGTLQFGWGNTDASGLIMHITDPVISQGIGN